MKRIVLCILLTAALGCSAENRQTKITQLPKVPIEQIEKKEFINETTTNGAVSTSSMSIEEVQNKTKKSEATSTTGASLLLSTPASIIPKIEKIEPIILQEEKKYTVDKGVIEKKVYFILKNLIETNDILYLNKELYLCGDNYTAKVNLDDKKIEVNNNYDMTFRGIEYIREKNMPPQSIYYYDMNKNAVFYKGKKVPVSIKCSNVQAVTGAEDFIFIYDSSKPQKVLLLEHNKKKASINLISEFDISDIVKMGEIKGIRCYYQSDDSPMTFWVALKNKIIRINNEKLFSKKQFVTKEIYDLDVSDITGITVASDPTKNNVFKIFACNNKNVVYEFNIKQ